jgi:hypothetical protein
MTAQPYQPAADRPAIDEDETDGRATDEADAVSLPATDPDLVIVPDDAVAGPDDAADPEDVATGPIVTGTVIEADAVDDNGPATAGAANTGAATNRTEDDLEDDDDLTGEDDLEDDDDLTGEDDLEDEDDLTGEDDLEDEDDLTGESRADGDVSDDEPASGERRVVAAQEDDRDGARTTATPVTTSPLSASPIGESAATGSPMAAEVRPAGLGEQWHDIQAMFVDDPRGSVQRAAAAADAAVTALAEELRKRQAAVSPAGGDSADTEQLRESLLSYRILCQNLADVGWQLRQPAP